MAEPNSLNEAIALINLYQTQYTQTDKIWGYFGTVTLAVLAFTLGSEKATKTIKESGVIILGYLVFCFGNFAALSKAHLQLVEFADNAIHAANSAGISFEHLIPLDISKITWFYWCVVTAVSIGIASITQWRKQSRNANG